MSEHSPSGPVRFIPLGGLGEIGMNCMAVEHGDSIVVIDCGVLFDNRGLGVDVIHADLEYLYDHAARVRALVLTHGHEDHLGAVSWFLRDFDVPVYGPPYALALVKNRIAEHPWHAGHTIDLRELRAGDRIELGPFTFEPWQVTHSMPECTGLVIRTPHGIVVHTGDFKIDDDPPEGERFDHDFIARVADEGVALMLSDSTNAVMPGHSTGEREVGDALEDEVRNSNHRVAIGMFASNVYRMRMLFDIARRTGRNVVCMGRSIETHVRIATELGHLKDTGDILVPRERARAVPRERLMILATGSQGEPAAALPRLASGSHPDLSLEPGDRVILSSRVIPGNERPILELIDALERKGIPVLTRAIDRRIHASGHAHRDEQKRVIETVRPRAFLPVHGTFIHLREHAGIARECGVPDVFMIENGGVLELGPEGASVGAPVWSGRVHIDRGGEPLGGRVIQDRKLLAELGVIFVSLVVDFAGRLVDDPDIVTRGVIAEDEDQELLEDARDYVRDAIDGIRVSTMHVDDDTLRDTARRAARRFFQKELGRKPLTYATVHRLKPS